ncbi:MAG: nucleoside deaminase [Verrucomicrobiales bacterium]
MRFPAVTLTLPDWIDAAIPPPEHRFATGDDRMALAIHLAAENVRLQTGGPFGAAIFDRERGTLIAPGVNLVVAGHASVAHAEIVAIAIAQQIFGTHDLGAGGLPPMELVTSVEPCAMCLGAIPWSGVRRVLCGAREEDARAIGFDEGAKPDRWTEKLAARGIAVTRDIRRDEAANVLRLYQEAGGAIYNGGLGSG